MASAPPPDRQFRFASRRDCLRQAPLRDDEPKPGSRMHPRLKCIAVDRSDHIDGMPDIRISSAPPDCFARRRAGTGQMRPSSQREHCPCHNDKNEHPGQCSGKTTAPARAVRIYSSVCMHIPRPSGTAGIGKVSRRRLKIRGDTFVLPVAVPRRFRALRTLELFCRLLGAGLGGFPARFGFGERALGRRRQLLARFGRWGRGRPRSIVRHLRVSSHRSNPRSVQTLRIKIAPEL